MAAVAAAAAVPRAHVEALACVLRTLDVDVLVTGHTHGSSIAEFDGKCYINPGSLTGAYSPLRATSRPSFVLMDVDGARVRPRFRTLRRAAPRACARADSARLAVAAGGVCVPAGGWRGQGGQDRVHEAANHRRKARMSSATEDALLWVTFLALRWAQRAEKRRRGQRAGHHSARRCAGALHRR
jgi:hypothetical protein